VFPCNFIVQSLRCTCQLFVGWLPDAHRLKRGAGNDQPLVPYQVRNPGHGAANPDRGHAAALVGTSHWAIHLPLSPDS